MRIKELAESIHELERVRLQEPEAEIFSVAFLMPGEQPRSGVLYVCTDRVDFNWIESQEFI